jgi:hypothetical protein
LDAFDAARLLEISGTRLFGIQRKLES